MNFVCIMLFKAPDATVADEICRSKLIPPTKVHNQFLIKVKCINRLVFAVARAVRSDAAMVSMFPYKSVHSKEIILS